MALAFPVSNRRWTQGGQNVNKVNTKAELRFRVADADWLPEDVRLRLAAAERSRVNREGEFIVASERHRTQHANLLDAIAKLQAMVDDAAVPPKERRMRTGLAESTKRERVRVKRHRSEVKSRRKGRGDDY